jgi:hypothetical protein
MFFRARRAFNRKWFDFRTRAVLKAPPLVPNDPSFMLVSMVCHGEGQMYLLAVRSFCLQLGRVPEIAILNDGSLTHEDLAMLRGQIPSLQVHAIESISTDGCPKRNCWERLFLICDLVQDRYVVQLDCDTLTTAPISEVDTLIRENRSFTLLGDRSWPEIEPMPEAHLRLKDSTSTQVQAVCERAFDRLPEKSELKYLRGNAGFTGFARGSLSREGIQWFSEKMRGIAEGHWDEWGSEQLTSNLLIANTPAAAALPAPKYVSYWNHAEIDYDKSAFLHFIGPFRYANGLYVKLAQRTIQRLNSR